MRFALLPVVALLVAVTPDRAEACGGTFCDGGGMNSSAVDQAYETVLFVQDGPYVEAHVQIAIDPNTDAQKFAWVIPVLGVPEFSVGSQPLFDALLRDTAARYGSRGDSCWDSVGFIQSPDGGSVNQEPDVIMSDVVGAFEVTVLQGGTVDGVMTWLGDNGYTQDPAAGPILGEYIDAGNVLVAFKLAPSATVAEIHPVVLRYLGDEPCVPLKITAIAANDDMGVRAFLLGESRWAPANWRHVVPNVVRIPWNGDSSRYEEAIARAVDEAPSGQAFVTEYAGEPDIVARDGIHSASWDASVFVDAEPTAVIDLLEAQQLATCSPEFGACIVPYQLVVAMLRKYLPVPEGQNENDFYLCLSCYADMTDFANWDGAAFAAELQERVIAPGQHAVELLDSWPYLTRLYTRVSAEEMTVDPIFHANADLPDVPLPGVAMQECLDCDGEDAVATLPDGRMVYLPKSSWPTSLDMPWAERIESIPAKGAPFVELDVRAEIDAALATWNASQECDPGGSASGSDEGDGYDDDDGQAEGGEAADGNDDDADDTTGGSAGQDGGLDVRGCACTTTPSSGAPLSVVLGALLRRRRERRS